MKIFQVTLRAVGGSLKYVVRFARRITCRHRFDTDDLVSRDAEGMVTWPCWKCGKTFRAECGLDILHHGEAKEKSNAELSDSRELPLAEGKR